MLSLERDLFAAKPTKPSIPTRLNIIIRVTLLKIIPLINLLESVRDLMPINNNKIGKKVTLGAEKCIRGKNGINDRRLASIQI